MSALVRFALVAVILCQSPMISGGEPALIWPQFRGPTGMGTSIAKSVPTTWSQQQNLAWKIKMPGPGASSPILIGERLYLTYYTGFTPGQPAGVMENLRLHVLCLDRNTGKTIWSKELMPRLPEQPTIRDNHGYASSTPIADKDRLYTFFGKSGVFAFDHDGKQLWHATVGDGLNGWGSAAPPVLHGDLLIINASVESSSLVAINKHTGKEVWRAGGIQEAWNMPLVVNAGGKKEVVIGVINKLLAFEPQMGAPLWSCKTEIPWYMVPSLVAQDDIVYAIGGRPGSAVAVRAGGRGDVTATHRVWLGKKGSNVSSPIYHASHLYWAHDALGIIFCADAETGQVVYEERLPGAAQFYPSPVLAEGRIYYLARDGRIFVVAARPEFQLLATNDLRDRSPFNASPAVADGRLYIRSDLHLYCVGMK
jgi:outer membrane protein assembly factor BamB